MVAPTILARSFLASAFLLISFFVFLKLISHFTIWNLMDMCVWYKSGGLAKLVHAPRAFIAS